MGARALTGTREGAASCGTCRHARVLHEDRGRGRCTRLVTDFTAVQGGGWLRTRRRCTCLRHTIDGRII